WRVIKKLRTEFIRNPKNYVWGVARRVWLEYCRDEHRRNECHPLCDLVQPPDDDDLHPALYEYHDRFRADLEPRQNDILTDVLWPEGRKRKEIAAKYGMGESALSEFLRRLNDRAERFHRDTIKPLFREFAVSLSEDVEDRILVLGRTQQ